MFSPDYVEVAVSPVPARKAARRALCLATLIMRGEIEMAIQDASPQQRLELMQGAHQQVSRRMVKWLEDEGVNFELSFSERILMGKPLGAWEPGESLRAVWRQESLATILWSMGLLPQIPSYDELVNQEELLKLVPVNRATTEFIAFAKYRPNVEIAHGRKAAEIWHWRSKIYQMQADPENYRPPVGATYESIIAIAAEMGELNGFYQRNNGDFPACGRPYRELSEESWSLLHGIAIERLYGFNWLCGYGEDWDHVPLEV